MQRPPFDDRATEADILGCFRLILGRDPNPEEWTGHSALAGTPLDQVVQNYLGSAEFGRRGLLGRLADQDIRRISLPDYDIFVPVDDPAVGRHVAHGVYEPDVAAVLRRWLQPGMAMLDLGANIGVFALLAAALVGPTGAVLAMEPNPANARLLEASRVANGFAHLTVCQAAAARSVGVMALHSFDTNGTVTALGLDGPLSARTVATLPPDMLVAERAIHVVKIDVEGSEWVALQGAAKLLQRCRPAIVSEFSPGLLQDVSGIDGPGYLRFLQGFGYQIGVIGPGGAFEPGLSVGQVMAAYEASGVDHIDIVGTQPGTP